MDSTRPRIALCFRYGPAEHSELCHALPLLVERLARDCEVHYFGMHSDRPVPRQLADNAVLHYVPFHVDRTRAADKLIKMAVWYLCLPFIALRCRRLGVRAIYIDDYLPLGAWFARTFCGPNVACMVADFLLDVYAEKVPLLRPVARLVTHLDLISWRKIPLIFTHARCTKDFLAKHGVPAERIIPVYDPCDFSIYYPADRAAAKSRFGFRPDDIVLVHHGILHPHKGNDRIIRALAPLCPQHPNLRYLLVGDGPAMPGLKALVQELRLENVVVLTGWLPELEDVRMALNAGDIGLVMREGHASDHFHVTGALVHSMACGLPILGARLGGVAEVIRDGENGFLFDPDDMDAFRDKLVRLMADAELRRQLGDNALRQARELFDMQRNVTQIAEPLIRLASSGTAGDV